MIALCAVLFASLFMASQCPQQTPEARTFATLQAAAAGIDEWRERYETSHRAGTITDAQKAKADEHFNRANDAIIAAARAARDGFGAQTPAEVNAAVVALIDFVRTVTRR